MLVFLNILPYTKHFHIITAIPNVFLGDLTPRGRLRPLAKTTEELMGKVEKATEGEDLGAARIGYARIEHFTWKDYLDFYTCTECGRCSDNCPATRTGKVLSPKHFTLDLRDHFNDEKREAKVDLVPNVIQPEVLWACTTCRACEEQCPVNITYVDKIVQMRRNLVMMRGEFPAELGKAVRGHGDQRQPVEPRARRSRRLGRRARHAARWRKSPNAEVLYLGGLRGELRRPRQEDRARDRAAPEAGGRRLRHPRTKKRPAPAIPRAAPATSTCSRCWPRRTPRRLTATRRRAAQGASSRPARTASTRSRTSTRTSAAKFEVVHHTDFLLGLIAEKKLVPKNAVNGRVVYHDSCYLGRYNDIYESPRAILQSIPGVELVEVEHWNKKKGLCCGAGGAQMLMEEQNKDRVNVKRTLQLLDTGATTIASACPFCMTMLTDGVKAQSKEDEVRNLDIAELLAEACGVGETRGAEPAAAE